MLAAGVGGNALACGRYHDDWAGRDKAAHFGVSFALGIGASRLSADTPTAVGLALLPGLAKAFVVFYFRQAIQSISDELIDAIAGKAAEISSTIGNAADSALKSIENHGGAFTVAMMNNSSDLARQINTASEIAIGAVSKSLSLCAMKSRLKIF